jgi:7tm Odorant receptor
VTIVRISFYSISMQVFNVKQKQLVGKIISDTKYTKANERFRTIIESYSRMEWKILILCCVVLIGVSFIQCWLNLVFILNESQLPFDFYIPQISSSTDWVLSYAFQLLVIYFAADTVAAYFAVTVIVISHASFKADTVICTVKSLQQEAKLEDFKNWLTRVTDESNDLIDFIELANEFVAPSCLSDILVLCSAVCLAMFSFSRSTSGSILCTSVMVSAIFQLYVYNLGGQQLKNKLSDLTFSVYNTEWYNLPHKQQKDVLQIMVALQKIKGFNGIFFELSHATFQKVNYFSLD